MYIFIFYFGENSIKNIELITLLVSKNYIAVFGELF